MDEVFLSRGVLLWSVVGGVVVEEAGGVGGAVCKLAEAAALVVTRGVLTLEGGVYEGVEEDEESQEGQRGDEQDPEPAWPAPAGVSCVGTVFFV